MPTPRATWNLDEFNGGIDLRDGLFTGNQSRMRELTNCFIDKGRKIRRRMPCLQISGDNDSKTQGYFSIDGVFYTIAKAGDSIANTGGVAGAVSTLFFTNPDYCSSWSLLWAGVFEGNAAAIIRHTYASAGYPSVVMLHVWDGLLYSPTFVGDPSFPGSFSPSIADLTDQRYDATFAPVFGLGVSKLWTSSLRGNAHCCRTSDARVWNERTKDSLLEDGEYWCFVVPEGQLVTRTFTVPRNADWMAIEGRWSYYVLEYNLNGVWTPMAETTIAPSVAYTWRPVSTVSRFAGGWNEIQLQICWGSAAAGLVRLSLVAGATSVEVTQAPTVSVLSGSGGAFKLSVTQAQFRWRGGDGQTKAAYITADLTEGKTYYLAVSGDSTNFPELLNLTDSGFPNGWGREARKFYKKISTVAAAAGSTVLNPAGHTFTPGAGTVTTTIGLFAVTGVGTSFLTLLRPGSTIRVAGVERVIATVTDNLNATVTVAWGASSAGVAWDVVYGYANFSAPDTHVFVDPTLAALLAVGNTLRINAIDYLVKAISGQDITVTISGTSGNYVTSLNDLYAVYRTTAPTVTDYSYAFEANADSDWYTNRVVEYIDLAGSEDALSLSTAAHDNTGGQISAIASATNHMLIAFPGSVQLWSVDQDTNKTAFLDQLGYGTGDQAAPSPVLWFGSVMLPMVQGFRAVQVIKNYVDSLDGVNVGEPIETLGMLTVRSAAFWPWYGQLIIAGKRGADLVFLCLDYSKESKITAWSQWTVAGLTDIDVNSLVADGSKMRFRSGSKLYYFDAAATVFRDFADVAGAAYESVVLFHFNDLDKPGLAKRFLALDIVQDGTCDSIQFQLPPYGSWGSESAGPSIQGPAITGITYGRTRIPLSMTGTAISPRLSTRSESGWRLQRFAFDFMNLRR